MSKMFILFIAFLFSSSIINAQEGRRHHKGPGEKMKDLEKAKLIEALNMDEETTLKFFSRRNAHMDKMEGFRKEEDDQIEKIDELSQNTDDPNDPQLKKMIEEYLKIRTDMDAERNSFMNSLTDILTYRQIAKLISFEPKFRDEIRKIILEKRRQESSK